MFLGTGAPFPMFDIEGNEVYMSDFKGKYVLVDTWATWCGPCKVEIPHLKEKEEKYGDQMVFLSLSFDENHEAWENFVKDENLTGVQVIAGKSSKDFMDYYMIPGYPQFLLLGKDGKIVNHNFIRPSMPPFDDMLEQIINES